MKINLKFVHIQCKCFHLYQYFVTEEAQGCPDLGCLDRVQEITVHETVEIMEGMNISQFIFVSSHDATH